MIETPKRSTASGAVGRNPNGGSRNGHPPGAIQPDPPISEDRSKKDSTMPRSQPPTAGRPTSATTRPCTSC